MYHYINLFFLLRLLRLYKAAELLDPHYIFAIFRNFHGSYIEYRIRNNHKDKNLFLHQLEMFKVGYLIIRLLMMLVCLSYFVGLLWYIYVKVIEQITFDMMSDEKEDIISFVQDYELEKNTNERNTVIIIYYSLTTLSSVGFGDYHPKNTMEYAGCTIIFLIVLFLLPLLINSLMEAFQLLRVTMSSEAPMDELVRFFSVL
jgi:hypothetical protein